MRTAQSSHIQHYDYDADNQTLTVTFINGASYQYSGVNFDDYNRLMQSGGSGTIFWALIRNRYATTKIASGTSMAGKRRGERDAARVGGDAQNRTATGRPGSS